jgi:Fic family protein
VRPEQFSSDSPGQLVRIPDGWAFLPNRLPPELPLNRELLVAADAARGAISELVGLAKHVANADLIMRPLVRREAVLSSRIEGTQTEIREVLAQEAAPTEAGSRDADMEEVLNYLATLDLGQRWFNDGRAIGVPLIKDLHARLLRGVRGKDRHPGALRGSAVYIGNRADGFGEARFVPPPPEHVEPSLLDLVSFLGGDFAYGPIVDCAIGHYQFETIHPFEDGNGRVGRLLIPLYLLQRQVLDRPFLYLSPYFDAHRQDYMDLLLGVSTKGRWLDWVLFFLRAVRAQAVDAELRVKRVLELQERYRRQVIESGGNKAALVGVDLVMERVYVSVPQLADFTKTTYPTAKSAADTLAELGIIQPYRRIRGTQYWYADELLKQVYEN